REAVVDRHQRDVLGAAKLEEITRHLGAAPHDQRPAVDPDEHRPRLGGIVAMDVELDLDAARFFVDEAFLLKRGGVGLKRGSEENRRDHLTYFRAPEPGAAVAGVRT